MSDSADCSEPDAMGSRIGLPSGSASTGYAISESRPSSYDEQETTATERGPPHSSNA